MKPLEQITIEPFERNHAIASGVYKPKYNTTNGKTEKWTKSKIIYSQ